MSRADALRPPCKWCGTIHGQLCPAVRAIEYHPDGSVKRVEFMTPRDAMPPSSTNEWPREGGPVPPYYPAPGGDA